MQTITFDYQPLDVNADFHRSLAYERALFGAFGSGKTYGICAEAIAWCLEQPGIRGLVTRKTVPELRDTTESVFFDILPPELYRAGTVTRLGGHVAEYVFPNGSKVLFRSIDDWQKHKSLNVGFIAWDEADEFDTETYLGMRSRVRQTNPTSEARARGYTAPIRRRGMWLATNPHGRDWLYQRFHPASSQRAPNVDAFFSSSFDNPYLPPDYLESLLSYPEPWIRRYVLCQFDDFAGQIYEDWAYETHVIEPIRDFRPENVVWMGMDPGTESPTAGVWVYVDQPNSRLVAVSEYQESGLAASKHTAAWRAIEAQKHMRVRRRIADPTITTRDRGTNTGLRDIYSRLGYTFELGPKSYKDRIPALGQLVHTRQFVATKECPRLFEQMQGYQWADLTPAARKRGEETTERPKKVNDHLVNCAEYTASRYVKPPPVPEPEQNEMTPWEAASVDIHARLRKQLIGRSKLGPLNHDLGGIPV